MARKKNHQDSIYENLLLENEKIARISRESRTKRYEARKKKRSSLEEVDISSVKYCEPEKRRRSKNSNLYFDDSSSDEEKQETHKRNDEKTRSRSIEKEQQLYLLNSPPYKVFTPRDRSIEQCCRKLRKEVKLKERKRVKLEAMSTGSKTPLKREPKNYECKPEAWKLKNSKERARIIIDTSESEGPVFPCSKEDSSDSGIKIRSLSSRSKRIIDSETSDEDASPRECNSKKTKKLKITEGIQNKADGKQRTDSFSKPRKSRKRVPTITDPGFNPSEISLHNIENVPFFEAPRKVLKNEIKEAENAANSIEAELEEFESEVLEEEFQLLNDTMLLNEQIEITGESDQFIDLFCDDGLEWFSMDETFLPMLFTTKEEPRGIKSEQLYEPLEGISDDFVDMINDDTIDYASFSEEWLKPDVGCQGPMDYFPITKDE